MTRPLLLGHRGARAFRHIPENTLPSFELCLQHGCDGFEFDVRLSGDGQAVICHDATSGGIRIENSTLKTLRLPTLNQVLEQFSSLAFLDIELKVAGLERQVLSELGKYPPQRGYVISSFLPTLLSAIHDLEPSVPLGYLCETPGQLRGWRQFSAEWIVPRCDLVSQELIHEIHDAGKKAMIWTVNRAASMEEFAEWGVDAIISDQTQLLVSSVR
jgi:glycerophosphoryl diester phosphodiesterase